MVQRLFQSPIVNGSPVGFAVHSAVLLGTLTLAALSLFTRGTYNNLFLTDLLYLLNAAYLVSKGLVPHIDFLWQFGGYETYLVALAMRLFGTSVEALQQAVALNYLILVALLYGGCYRRAGPLVFAGIWVVLTATALTRYPFENGPHDLAVQTLAMWYNRACWAAAMVLFATLILGGDRLRTRELAVCGACMFLIALTKVTFVLLLPLAIALLLWRNGLRGALVWSGVPIGLAVAGWLALGFGPAAYARILPDALDAVQDYQGASFGPVAKLIYMLGYNFVALALLATGAAYLAWRHRRERAALILIGSLVLLLGLSFGAATTTGTFLALWTTTPMLAFVAVLLADRAMGPAEDAVPQGRAIAAGLYFYAASFVAPYLLNYVAAVAKQVTRQEQSIFPAGTPLAGLIIDQLDTNKSPPFRDERHALAYIQQRSRLEGGSKWMQDYEYQYLVKDALTLARTLPDLKSKRVLSLPLPTASFLLGAEPLTSFPLTAGLTSPSMQKLAGLPADVGAILVPRADAGNPLLLRFRPSIDREFALAGRSALWDYYIRRTPTPTVPRAQVSQEERTLDPEP
jgi:hypothetical protein